MQLHGVVTNIEKFTNYRFFFLFTSFLLVFESFSIFLLNTSIIEVNFEFIKMNTGYILLSLSAFSLFASFIPPMIIFILKMICSRREESYFEQEDYIERDDLLKKALHEKSNVDYILLKDNEQQKSGINSLLKYSIIFVFSIILNACFNNSIVSSGESFLEANKIIAFIIGLLTFSLVIFINQVICEITDKVYYPDCIDIRNNNAN